MLCYIYSYLTVQRITLYRSVTLKAIEKYGEQCIQIHRYYIGFFSVLETCRKLRIINYIFIADV